MVDDESWYSGRAVLITGGLGFIGSSLAIRMVALGAKVTLLDAMIPEFGGNWKNIEPIREQVRLFQDDMRNFHALTQIVKGQDAIFHLAGQVSHGDSMREPLTDLGVNCVSTMNLVEACRIHNPDVRIVYTSTRQVYGTPQMLPVKEDHPVMPVDVNGINKLAAEYYHLLYHRVYDVKSTVLRLTNTYGPRLHKSKTIAKVSSGYFLNGASAARKFRSLAMACRCETSTTWMTWCKRCCCRCCMMNVLGKSLTLDPQTAMVF